MYQLEWNGSHTYKCRILFTLFFQDSLQKYWNLVAAPQTGSKNDNNNNKMPYFK